MNSFCLTCLSNALNGVLVPSAIEDFLQNILRFKFAMRDDLPKLVCLTCYRMLSEMKRFYVQLKDVQHYLNQSTLIDPEEKAPQGTERKAVELSKQKPLQLSSHVKYLRTKSEHLSMDNETEIEESNTNSGITKELIIDPIESVNSNIQYVQDSYKCEKCFRVFEEIDSYQKHVQWHISHEVTTGTSSNEKKYECNICGKRFRTLAEQRVHDVTHTDLRPFKCNVCHKTFRQLSGLSVHRAVHYGKRIECPDCGKRFATKFELRRHFNVHNKTFDDTEKRKQLKDYNSRHGESFKCDICSRIYCNEETLKAHVNTAHHLRNDEIVTPKKLADSSYLENDNTLLIEEHLDANSE